MLYVVGYAVLIFVIAQANHSPPGDRKNYLTGVSDLMLALVDLFELLTFYLVVFLMLPMSELQQNKKKEFTKFLHRGFVDMGKDGLRHMGEGVCYHIIFIEHGVIQI